ncbi:unnamed protein product [Ostreobium quekettii]|uniref:Uncharacterized protein n=1 Tax=Ostreobium quekettii TaxID=121088 RepID=A0A8S1J6K3_9CHLO|nr:unnamed protein product [Ostreobium quekettii]|eukprot:evm.model.scf_1043EXC.2 EVM.evm.TU.scf_1043EXC.2   scf_1043EXC:33267-33584(+)
MLWQKMRLQGLTAADIAAVNSSLQQLLAAVEKLSQLKEYRTPQVLRSMVRFYVVVILPLFYGPLWAQVKMEMGFVFALFLALMVRRCHCQSVWKSTQHQICTHTK